MSKVDIISLLNLMTLLFWRINIVPTVNTALEAVRERM